MIIELTEYLTPEEFAHAAACAALYDEGLRLRPAAAREAVEALFAHCASEEGGLDPQKEAEWVYGLADIVRQHGLTLDLLHMGGAYMQASPAGEYILVRVGFDTDKVEGYTLDLEDALASYVTTSINILT